MDFNQLMARMRELDQPVVAAPQVPVEECGEPMGMNTPVSNQPPHTPPSLSVNLNAQGMDDIESIMRLMTKVNPDMINQPAPVSMPPISAEPSIMSIKPPMPGLGDLGNLDAGPLKMLPDLDKDEPHAEPDADNMGGPSDNDADNKPPMGDLDSDDKGIDAIQKAMGDNDGDGDRDEKDDDADSEKDDKKEKEEAWGNGLTGHDDVDYKGMDAAIPDGDDLNKPKQMSKHSYRQGDNPMAMESEDLRAYVRSELQRRLNEAKGVK